MSFVTHNVKILFCHQDNLYKLLVEFMRQNKGAALQRAELSELWQALGKVYRDDQFDFYSQIMAFCALLQQQSRRGGGPTGAGALRGHWAARRG